MRKYCTTAVSPESEERNEDKAMKNRKLAKVAVIVTIIIFTIYKFITPPITYKIDSTLVEINDTLKALSEEHGFDFLSVYSCRTNSHEFSDIVLAEVYKKVRKLNIHVIHFYSGPDYQMADFRVDRFLFSLSPAWYYLYSENGLI